MKAQIFSGVRLKKARLFNEMTLSDLAKEISAIPHSITKQSLSLYENGSVAPKYETILAFVKVLQFPYDYFSKMIHLPAAQNLPIFVPCNQPANVFVLPTENRRILH